MTSQPASALGWLDYREVVARHARDLLRAVEEKGTFDSIGSETVHDALRTASLRGENWQAPRRQLHEPG